MLSTLVYVPHGLEQGWTTDPNVTDWSTNGPSGPYQCWSNTDSAEFPVSAAGPVTIVDSLPGQQLIYASAIIIDDGASYTFKGSTPNDQLQITAAGTTIEPSLNPLKTTSATIGCAITGPGKLDVDMNYGSTVILGANNSYSGGTDVQGGTLKLAKDPTSGAGALLGTGTVTVESGATLDLNGCYLTMNSLSGDGTITDTSSGPGVSSPVGVTVLTIANSSGDTFSGSITDSYSIYNPNVASIRLVKSGAGTLILGGGGTYSGGTEIDGGTLQLASAVRASG